MTDPPPFPLSPLRRRRRAVVGLAAVVLSLALAACSDDDGDGAARSSATEPDVEQTTTTFPRVRPSAEEYAALDALARIDVSGLPEPPPPAHDEHSAHDLMSAPTTVPLDPETEAQLAEQLDAAAAAAEELMDVQTAIDQGYAFGSQYAPRVGTHYVKWSMVDQPFDPATPSMLLYDGDGPDARLVGFSYWVASPTEPEGFAGPNDIWHRHLGLCLEQGQPAGENLDDPSQCPNGVFLDGRNLWMLHAWVVPGVENPWGVFATVNPAVG